MYGTVLLTSKVGVGSPETGSYATVGRGGYFYVPRVDVYEH